jgi:hypothetical protein
MEFYVPFVRSTEASASLPAPFGVVGRCRRTEARNITRQWPPTLAVEYHHRSADTFIRSPTERLLTASGLGPDEGAAEDSQ